MQQQQGASYQYRIRSICSSDNQSSWTPWETYTIPADPDFEPSFDPDPSLTATPNTPEAEVPTGSVGSDGSVVEPVETNETNEADAAIENLFTEPISIVVPMDSTAKDDAAPTTFDVLPANASLEQLQVAARV